jgi:hypothetical protein
MSFLASNTRLGRLGSLGLVFAGALVILGTDDVADVTVERIQTERFEVGQKELRFFVRARPVDEIDVRVTPGVTLHWLNGPQTMPEDPYRNYVKSTAIRLDCDQDCGERSCQSFCDELWLSVTRDDTLSTQAVTITVDAAARPEDIQSIEIERDE